MSGEKKYTFDQKQIIIAFAGNCLVLLLVFILGVKIGKSLFSNAGLPSDQELFEKVKSEKVKLTFPDALQDGGKNIDEVEPPKNLPIIPTEPPKVSEVAKAEEPVVKQTHVEVVPVKEGEGEEDAIKSGYTVQIGSFISNVDARRMADKYRKLGFDTYIVSVKIKKGVRYRVRSGRYKAKEDGYAAMKLFVDKHGLKPLVVRF